jgi:ADP-ribose pyrophosphatase YjhB (NUDIX family)
MPDGWMIDKNDPACLEIVARAEKLGITGDPDKAAHFLGTVTLADGSVVRAHVVHAADAFIYDGKYAVMIDRKNEPGKGLPAMPGGLIDPLEGGGVETTLVAARREAKEEAGADLTGVKGTLIGTRNMNRPHDVRVAKGNHLEKYGIKAGDIFMVSGQAVRFDVPDVLKLPLRHGDDAKAVRPVEVAALTRNSVGIPDHYDMIMQGVAKGGKTKSRKLAP